MKKNKMTICFIHVFMSMLILVAPPGYALDSETKDTEKIIITADEIEKMNVTDIVDLLNRVPGIKAGESSVGIHGSCDVKVFLDGRPLNDPLASHNKIKWNMVSLQRVERIEIYKGMGAVSFGDGTSGGAVCILSKEIHDTQGKIKTEWGNLDTQQYSLNAGYRIGSLGFSVAADDYHTGGYRTNQDKDSRHVGVKTAYLPQSGASYNLSLDYADEDRGKTGYPAYPTPHAREKSGAHTASLAIKAGGFTGSAYFGSYEQRSADPDRSFESQVNGFSAGEDMSFRFTEGYLKNLVTGLSFRTDHIKGISFDPYHEESYGLSLSKGMALSGIPLSCTLGLRANLYSAFETVVNPEMKLSYDLKIAMFQFSAARTNNVPPVLKRFYESSSTRANPSLGMEKATNLSFSVVIPYENAWETGVTFFYNEIDDKITYVRDVEGSQGMYRNFGKVTRKGADLSVGWSPCTWFNLKLSYEYLMARDENTGLIMACSPEHRAQLGIQYKPIDAFTAAIVGEYTAKQYTRSDNTEYADPYNTIDVKADYVFRRWRIFGRIKNLTDEAYLYGDGLPAPPRTWLIGMNVDF